MAITMLELKQLIIDNCDFSKPLRVVAHDVGKKAAKHSAIIVDGEHPATISVTPGRYDERGVFELAHNAEASALMPQDVIDAIDNLLEEVPKATLGWVYFFYFPMKYTMLFKGLVHIANSLLDTADVMDVYFSDEEPNTLVIKAKYGVGSFD